MTARAGAIHLDAVGGIAGDMFAAAILDARPDLWPACERAIAALGLDPAASAAPAAHGDGLLHGSRFVVQVPKRADHTPWREIRSRLAGANLEGEVRGVALAIFAGLAQAEATIHNCTVDEVTFHEVGAQDSLIDIVTAAVLITALQPCRWSIGPIPRGRGQVETAHGILPLPAPATVELLKGFVLVDDGEAGERVTPTGAAVIKYLDPSQSADPVPRRLIGAGMGFGTRSLRSRSNVLRATLYAEADDGILGDQVAVFRFEIDDQTAEDLAIAVSHIRAADGVLDVCQWPVFAKKGRLATALQVLAEPGATDIVIREIFRETTTLGIRHGVQSRSVLARQADEIDGVGVKLAMRPEGATAKTEAEDLASIKSQAARQNLRRSTEAAALEKHDAAKN